MTPVNYRLLGDLLIQSDYDYQETKFLVEGFRDSFDLGYKGEITGIQRLAPNLKIRVGSEVILWNKVMKEVSLCRYAGPYQTPPYKDFIQSPISLVPKGQNDTRLIFHLSYP